MAAAVPSGTPSTTTRGGPFTLTRCTPADMDAVVRLQYDCFPPFIREMCMGCFSEADIPKIRDKYVQQMREDPRDIWVKVVEERTGEVVAGSCWKVWLNGTRGKGEKDAEGSAFELDWLDPETRAKSAAFLGNMSSAKMSVMEGVPFINLLICFTSATHRRRGAGSMMLKWGCEVADLLGLAGWVEASEEGNFLYKVHGFEEHSKIEGGELGGVNMLRAARPWAIRGGK